MILHKPRYTDPFAPVLLSSPPVVVTLEQQNYIREILETACSDSRFAEKAYAAIWFVLTHGSVVVPSVTSLVPNSAEIGDPSFTLHVHGTGFKAGDVIVFNGGEEPTTLVSGTELTTTVNMSTVSGASVIPVGVASVDGVMSNVMNFTFTDGVADSLKTDTEKKYAPSNQPVSQTKSSAHPDLIPVPPPHVVPPMPSEYPIEHKKDK